MDRAWSPRGWLGLVALLLAIVALADAPAVAASSPATAVAPPQQTVPDRRYVAETGHTVQGGFLDLWRSSDEERFGLPISEEFDDVCAGRPCTAQYFERGRLDYDPTTSQVTVGQLGVEAVGGRTFEREAPFASTPDRWYIQETGYALACGFLRYWLTHDGPARLGHPISPELTEADRTVQYFERGRLDYQAALPDGERVTVVALGRLMVERRGWTAPAIVTLATTATTVAQGLPIAVALRGAVDARAELAGEALPLRQSASGWRGLIGIAPWAEPGPRPLVLLATAPDGSTRRFERWVTVTVADFPRERFMVPEGQGDLLSPEVRDRELAAVRPLYGLVTPAPLWRTAWRWPALGRITTEFATRRAYNDGPYSDYHGGIDIAAPTGAPVIAATTGRVAYAGPLAIRGNFIAIDHGLGVLTTYFHLSAIEVTAGQLVEAGQLIGRVGSTGLSSGPHLHWEARVTGTPVDPRAWLATDLLP